MTRRFSCNLRGWLLVVALLLALLSAGAPGASPRFFDDDPLWEEVDTQDASGVQPWKIDLSWDLVENIFTNPGDRQAGTRAMNVNTVNEVPDGAWFTNRAGRRPLTPEEVARGANTGSGPAAGRWTIVSSKSDGATPGFTIRDENGDVWFLKFDPPEWKGMATGTEVVVAKLFWALGYHTPECHIAKLRAGDLVIGEGAHITPPGAKTRPMRQSDLDWLLGQAARETDGTYRVIASKALPGKPLGGFRFYGTRPDDPNDIIPHEHRRELRGYGTFAAWFNHVDAKSINSLDTLVTASGRAYVRHYLLDFGSTLGSSAYGPREHWEGSEYLVDGKELRRGILAFGFSPRPWRSTPVYEAPAIGRVSRDDTDWDPEQWKPRVPNPAFRRARLDDKFWAARKAAAITDEMIRAAVVTGAFGDPQAGQQVARVLIQRRDAILRRYLPAIDPIVDPELDRFGVLRFANAAAAAGVAAEPAGGYRAEWAAFDNTTGATHAIGETSGLQKQIQAPPGLPTASGAFVRVGIRALTPQNREWEKPVFAYFRRTADGWKLVGFDSLPESK